MIKHYVLLQELKNEKGKIIGKNFIYDFSSYKKGLAIYNLSKEDDSAFKPIVKGCYIQTQLLLCELEEDSSEDKPKYKVIRTLELHTHRPKNVISLARGL